MAYKIKKKKTGEIKSLIVVYDKSNKPKGVKQFDMPKLLRTMYNKKGTKYTEKQMREFGFSKKKK